MIADDKAWGSFLVSNIGIFDISISWVGKCTNLLTKMHWFSVYSKVFCKIRSKLTALSITLWTNARLAYSLLWNGFLDSLIMNLLASLIHVAFAWNNDAFSLFTLSCTSVFRFGLGINCDVLSLSLCRFLTSLIHYVALWFSPHAQWPHLHLVVLTF